LGHKFVPLSVIAPDLILRSSHCGSGPEGLYVTGVTAGSDGGHRDRREIRSTVES
jgi:hypothetical protein